MGIFHFDNPGLTLYYYDRSGTAVPLTEKGSPHEGEYSADDTALVAAGLPAGITSGRIQTGDYQSPGGTDEMRGVINRLNFNGTITIDEVATIDQNVDVLITTGGPGPWTTGSNADVLAIGGAGPWTTGVDRTDEILAWGGAGPWTGTAIGSSVLPNLRLAPRLIRDISRRSDGIGRTTEPFRVYSGETTHIAVNLKPVFGTIYVTAVSNPVVEAGGTMVFDNDPSGQGGLQQLAVFRIQTPPEAGVREQATSICTLENGDIAQVVFDVETMTA